MSAENATNNRANRIENLRRAIPLSELIEFPSAMTEAQLHELPEVTITKAQVKASMECSVCFVKLKSKEKVRQLPCNHMYHEKCIFPWLQTNPSCPICRAPMPDQGEEDFDDIISAHFDSLTRDLIRHLTETGEHSEAARLTASLGTRQTYALVEIIPEPQAVDESNSARTLRSRRPRRIETPEATVSHEVEVHDTGDVHYAVEVHDEGEIHDEGEVRVSRRAAALRADHAIQKIYRPHP